MIVDFEFGEMMKKLLIAMAVAGLALSTAQAQTSGTLKKIKDSGKIVIGVRDASIPFSYTPDGKTYVGYSVDLCDKIASAAQRKLGMTELQRIYQPVTSATRIPLMANGTIDLECGSTTNNLDRQKQVSFAPTTFITANRLLAKKTSNVTKLDDLKGKTMVSTNGTTNLRQVNELNTQRNLGMTIMTGKDHGESFLMVETGRAVAFAMDDILLASLAANSKNPGDFMISSEALSVEPYGLMLRRDDPEFQAVADQAIKNVFSSGEIKRIYDKWFMTAIPPKNITLNIPMSGQLQAAVANPTNSGDPAAYAAVPQAQQDTMKKKK
jgi:glutamate/aspartate transport system substrate-binding protein